MSEGSRGARSYWSKYRSIKRSVRRQVEDLQEDSDKLQLAQEKNFPENTENQDTPVRRKFTCLNTNSPDQCDTGSSIMSITENDLCEKMTH